MGKVFGSKAVQSSDTLNKFKLESYKGDYKREQEEPSVDGSKSQRPWANQAPNPALTPTWAECDSLPRLSSDGKVEEAEIGGI